MLKEQIKNVLIRRLYENENIPYELLLLADPSRELIDKYLKTSEVYVALLDNDIIGTYVLYPVSPNVIEIKNISVDDEYQGRGVGTQMLRDAFKKANEKCFKAIIIGTGNSSVGQLYLYQKAGFKIIEIRKDFFIDNYPEPIYENGIQVKHMIVLRKQL
ncbi:MAG: GNAT family N-acetyltransferase [Chitinophagaceae bacterium]